MPESVIAFRLALTEVLTPASSLRSALSCPNPIYASVEEGRKAFRGVEGDPACSSDLRSRRVRRSVLRLHLRKKNGATSSSTFSRPFISLPFFSFPFSLLFLLFSSPFPPLLPSFPGSGKSKFLSRFIKPKPNFGHCIRRDLFCRRRRSPFVPSCSFSSYGNPAVSADSD